MADDGGVIYGMANKFSDSQIVSLNYIELTDSTGEREANLGLISTFVKDNWAQQNLIHILLSTMVIDGCKMDDNYAQYVTHGITLISSKLEVKATEIRFTNAGLEMISKLVLDKLDTGFFNLYLGSELYLS